MIEIPGFQGTLKRDHPLARLTTWRVGGPAEVFAVPQDVDDLLRILRVVQEENVPLYILGRGSNILIDDAGLPGITIQLGPGFNYMRVEEEKSQLRVGAGLPMPTLAKSVSKLGYTGFEHWIGIPGSVGAGVVINAGKGTYDGDDMRDVLHEVTYVNGDLELVTEPAEKLELSYRRSRLQGNKAIVIEAVFNLTVTADPEKIRAKYESIIAERRAKFPLHLPNVGSVFKRPENAPTAGWLIESVGLKGYRIGDAQVSETHANFIVNLGKATSADIKSLIELVQEKVQERHGLLLERETIYLPESQNWQ